ncbi:MAG: hypothetical protein KKE05_04595 [Nanoarchaeota archaeon]|nr:hypothetical protein [Nanoarchaeota archaeon]
MVFNKKKFISFFIKNGGITFFDKSAIAKYSGKPSTIYFNWRTVAEDVYTLEKCADYIIPFVQDHKINPDCFVGVPEGATKLAIITQFKWAKKPGRKIHKISYVRGNLKRHGVPKDRNFLGIPEGKVVLLEDIVYKGGGILDTIKKLKKVNTKPHAIIVLSDRTNKKSKQRLLKILSKEKIKFYSLTQEREVVEEAVRILKPSEKMINKLKARGRL